MAEDWGTNDPVVDDEEGLETWGENDPVIESEQDQQDWGINDPVVEDGEIPTLEAAKPATDIVQQYGEISQRYNEKGKALTQASERFQQLAAQPERTPEEEVELTSSWEATLQGRAEISKDAAELERLQPQYDKYFADQKQARIDYIEDRRGSGVFGDEAAEALYDIDARAEQEYAQARTIEDTDKRKEAMAAIQAKYQAEEKDLTNQYVERFKENETKINNAAEVIGQAFAKGQTVDQFLLETGADAEEFNELRDSLINQDDPEKGKLFREARAMVDLAEGTNKVGIVNNEIRISPLHMWDAEGIKGEIEALDISDAKKRTAISAIPQLQKEAAKAEYPWLKENVSEFNSFVKDNNLENVSPERQIAEWKGRNDGWLGYALKSGPQAVIGLRQFALNLLGSGQTIVGATASIMGAQKFADPFLDAASKTSDEIERLERISQEIGGPTLVKDLTSGVAQVGVQIGFGGAVGFGAKRAGFKPKTVSNIGFGSSVGAVMAQSYGSTLMSAVQTLEKEKIDGGMDPTQARAEAVKEAQLPAALSGLVEGVVTVFGGKKGSEAVFREGPDAIKAKLNTPAFRAQLDSFYPNIAGGGTVEGVEELIAQLAQGFIEQATFNPNLTTSEIVNNGFKALIIGGTIGVGVEGLKYGFDYMNAPKEMARREASMASIRQSIADAEQDISNISASSPIGSEFQREYDATLPSDEAANLGGVAVDRTRMGGLQSERQQLAELLEDPTISRVARNQLEGKLAAADIAYYNEVLVPMRRNVVNEQMVDQLDGMVVSQKTKDGLTAMAKIANGLGAESLTGRERVAVGITSVGGGRFLPSIKNPMVEVNEAGQATVTEAGRLMAENVGLVPLVRMIGLSESTRAKQAEMERVVAEAEARKAQQDAKDTAESEEAKRYGPASAEALKQQVAAQPTVPETQSNARLAQLLKEQEEAARKALEAVKKPETPPVEEPPVTPELEPLRRVTRAEQTPEDVAALTEAGLIEIYKDQPVLTQAGIDALPEAERPRLNPEARKIQIDTRTSEPVAEAISKGLRIGVDQVPFDVKMPEGWTIDGDIYVPPAPVVEPPVTPPVEPPVTPPVAPPVQPPVEPPVAPPVTPPVTPPPIAPTAGAITEEQANNVVKTAQEERAKKNAPTIGRSRWGPQSIPPKAIIGGTAREALITASRLNLSKIAQSNPNEIMMQDVAAILAELNMPILDLESVASLSSLRAKGRPRRWPGIGSVIGMPSTTAMPVEILVHELGHTLTADQIKRYLPRKKTGSGKAYLDALNKAITNPDTPEAVSRLFSLYVSTIEQLGITEQYFGAKGVAGTPKADTSKAMAKRLQAKGLLRKDLKGNDLYGLANVEEFVSQTFSEPSFRNILKGLKDPTNPQRTLWQAFVDAIQNILQLPKGSMAAGVIETSIDVGMTVPSDRALGQGGTGTTTVPAPEPEMATEPENALGYDIVTVVEDIKAGRTDGPLRAINNVVKDSTELRDRIKRESQKRQKPRARGQAPILERIARERSSGKISEETAQALIDFVNTIRPDAIGDTAISIRGAGAVSNFDFGNSLVSFYLTQDQPEMGARIGIHEFWHGLSRFLPKKELAKMSKDYTRELAKYIDANPWFLAFVGRYSLTPEQFEAYKIFNPEEAETKLEPVLDSNGEITKYNIRYDKESYRYIMLDEWIAENMTDLVRQRQGIPDTFLGKLSKIFIQFLDLIEAKLGLDPYESFYQLVTDPEKKLQLYRMESVARPFQIYQPQTYNYGEDLEGLIRFNALAPEPEVREASQKHSDAIASNNTDEAQRLTDEVAAIRKYQSENLLFHGTTHIFNVFRKDRTNVENDFGKGYYLTNTEADAQINYAGEGPDLTNRIERLSEQLQDNENLDETEARKKATEILSGGGQRIMRVYVRLENPFNVGGSNETFLDYEMPYNETTEEYGEPTGKLAEFLQALRPIVEGYSEDSAVEADKAVGNIAEYAMDRGGISASDLVRLLKQEDSGIMWANDENGDSATSEIIRQAIEDSGFDGIVDGLVNQKFGRGKKVGKVMEGMGPDTVHTIVFDSSQIKSADAATYNDDGNLIPLSQRFLAEEQDVRFSPEEEFEIIPEQIEDQIEGTPEASTIKVMGEAFRMADEQSATAGTQQGTLPMETIVSAWMGSGRDVETLENAIIRYTNLEPEVAATLAEAIGKQVEIQRGIMEISDAASRRKAEKEEEPETKPYSFAERIKGELPRDLRSKINLAYEVLRNEVSVQEANQAMSGLTVDEAIRATEDMKNGISMPVRSMMGQIVLRKIMAQRKATKGKKGKEADYAAIVEAHVDFFNFFSEYSKELGQGVQAIARFSDLGADGILLKVRKDVDKAISKHITNRRGQIDQIKRDVEDADNAAFNAAIKANKGNIDNTAKKAGEQEAKKMTIEEQAQKLAIRAAKKVTGEEVRRRQPDPLSDLVNGHLRRYNANFVTEATAMGVSPVTAQAIEDSAKKLRDSRVATKNERERFKEMQDERMKVKKELARENKYIYGPRPTIWENYQDMFSERLARRLMRDPKKKVPPSLLLFTDRLTENLLGFIPEAQRQTTTQRSFQAMIEDALNNKEKYQEAFNRALEDISFKVMELETKAAFGERVSSDAYKKAVAAQEFMERLEPIIQQFPVSDKLIMRFVNQKMKAMGESLVGRYNDWYRSSIKTRINIEKALAEKLMEDMNVSNADAINLSRAVIKDFRAKAEERREKALARFKKPKEKTKRLAESPLKKFFELVNIGVMTDKDAYEVMAHRFELPTWDAKFAKQIGDMALIVQDMPEGLARRRMTRNMMAEIARKKGFSLSDLGSGFFYSNMLSSIETFLINLNDTLLGNWVQGLASSVADKDFTRLNGLMAGYSKGWREAINVFNTGLRINMPRLEEKTPLTVELINYGRKGGVALESTEGMNAIAKTILESPPARVLNLWKYVTRIMEATDALNYTASAEGQRYAEAAKMAKDEGLEGNAKQKRINQILNLGDGAYQSALKQAEQEGYTGNDAKFRAMEVQDEKIDAGIRERGFDRALTDVYRNMPTGLAGFMAARFNNIVMSISNPWFRNAFKLLSAPFVITPTNLFNRWLDYSPYGFKRLFYGSGNLLDKDTPYYVAPPKAGSSEFYTQALKASSSVMVMGLAYGLVKAGLLVLRGIGPSDEEERKQWIDDGNRAHTFSFMGGPQISYQFSPWALVLSWMANSINWDQYNAKPNSGSLERGFVGMKFAIGVIMDLPFFAGPAEFMDVIQKTRGDAVATPLKYLEGKMGMVYPNLVRQIDRFFDPTLYNSDGLKGVIIDQMPFARRLGTQRVNLFGDPIGEDKPTMDRLVGRIISFPTNPSRESRILAKYDIYPYMPSPQRAQALVDGEKARMTEEQYNKFVQIVGKDVKQRINDLFDPDGEITEQERERGKKRISKIFERARARGVREVSTY